MLDQLVRAQLRLAEMYSEATMEADKAVVALRAVCAEARAGGQSNRSRRTCGAAPVTGWRRSCTCLGRYGDARGEIEGLIELATQPGPGGQPLSPRSSPAWGAAIKRTRTDLSPRGRSRAAARPPPQELARHYGYLGRILDAGRDRGGAAGLPAGGGARSTFAPPVLALARRAAHAGDRAQAEHLVREALAQVSQHRPQRQADQQTELQLRGGMAYLQATFAPQQAADAFVGIIELGTQNAVAEGIAVGQRDVRRR